MTQQHPPGWYPNPENAAQLRWWDGTTWTGHTAPLPTWQQSGWDAPPKPKRRIWPWIVFPAIGLFVLFGVSAAIFVPKVIGAFKHPIDAANVYYGDIRDRHLTDAYDHLCTRVRREQTLEEFVQGVQTEEDEVGHITKLNAHEVHRVSNHGNEALVDIDLTTTRESFAIQALMLNENGHWQWCGRRRVTN